MSEQTTDVGSVAVDLCIGDGFGKPKGFLCVICDSDSARRT